MLSTSRLLGDVLKDGKLDFKDYAVIAAEFGKTGATVADIAGPQGLGMPDGKVDYLDIQAFLCAMTGHQPPQGPQPTVSEGFQSGDFSAIAWRHSGDESWVVTADQRHMGKYSAKAGSIGGWGTSTLEVTIPCKAGQIEFSCKVSSEQGCDFLKFFVDGVQVGQWSGQQDWAEVSFPVKAGQRTFTWSYTKDAYGSAGADTAWIDDIVFPVE